jgi:hypothetical protein
MLKMKCDHLVDDMAILQETSATNDKILEKVIKQASNEIEAMKLEVIKAKEEAEQKRMGLLESEQFVKELQEETRELRT